MIYHYCAQFQNAPGEISYIDGIVISNKPVDSMDRYRELKKAIAPDLAPEKLTITALTALPPSQ